MVAMLLALLTLTTSAQASTQLNSAEDVAKAFAKHRPMVILFHAEWCSWCKKEEPEYAKAEQELKGQVDFYVIDIDHIKLKMTRQVGGIPAFVCGSSEKSIRSGKTINDGYQDAKRIVAYIKYTLAHEESILKGTL